MIAELAPFTFSQLETQLECFASRESREQLLQWNLDTSLSVDKFRFGGVFTASNPGEYDRILKDFFRCSTSMAQLGISGTPSLPLSITSQQLSTNVMSMEFFDRLTEGDVVSASGQIRQCLEEIYDGISAGDKLRELLLNEDSENASLFTPSERQELIFVLFRTLVLGGSMCQPDDKVGRYLEMTRGFYRDILTVYKREDVGAASSSSAAEASASAAGSTIAVSGKVYKVNAVAGLELFAHEKKSVNLLLVVVDPMKKQVVTVKVSYKPFW